MASVAAISSLSSSICTAASERIPISTSLTSSLSFLRFDRRNTTFFLPNCCLYLANKKKNDLPTRIRAVAEETLASEEEGETKEEATSDQTVSVPVSSSDVLTMFFQAEGTMTELAVGNVRKALEGVEDVSDLKVQVLEGIASVELKKQTTVQATGVASNLVEVIQGSGFKLQTLNLSFEDEEDVII